jgi:hypothetical protein
MNKKKEKKILLRKEKYILQNKQPSVQRGPGTREKVSLRIITLEDSTHVQESNSSKLPV